MPNRATLILPLLVPLSALAGPDVIVGDLTGSIVHYGEVGGIHAYSFGVTACNPGDAPVDWFASTNRHPVFATQLYRLDHGRFEQIGIAWAMHEFAALASNFCGTCTPPGDVSHLGIGCSTVDSAGITGSQFQLGPRTEIDPATGDFPYPFGGAGGTGDAIYKRLQAGTADLSVPAARYFVEGLFVASDDAAAGNTDNNATWREVTFMPGSLNASFVGGSVAQQPAIEAWQQADPGVRLTDLVAPDGGRLIVGSRATDLGNGTWAYEYAVYNMNSSMPAVLFKVPHGGRYDVAPATDIGFHDVNDHSGEPIDPADWTDETRAFSVVWTIPTPAPGLDANTLRWGTLKNFRFVSFYPPADSSVVLHLDDHGSDVSVSASAVAPGPLRCNEADFAAPYFVRDLADIQAFLNSFLTHDGLADLAAPFGVYDLADIQRFLAAFVGECD
ncbi:MAG: hypothetical protein H6810_04410 [Phycisphaeraceae bacterium]|nr:MAG: hypothetical protein H6810_04410 [Phycisphaeraceae bacterium]